MKKKITAMLLAICCISSTWTVYADDFSSGSSEVEIEITEAVSYTHLTLPTRSAV